MLVFHPLTISALRPEANDAISITFAVPDELKAAYRFSPGQHVGIRARIAGQDVRRTYSICSAIDERDLRIGLRVQHRGLMSQHLSRMQVDDVLDVMTPTGRFFQNPEPTAERVYCAFAVGSGITPILGILKNVLQYEPCSRFLLFYGNRTAASTMFAEELLALKDRHIERLSLHFLLSREPQDIQLLNGRLDGAKVAQLGRQLFDARGIDAFLLCGPGTMVADARGALVDLGVDPSRIHAEHFGSVTAGEGETHRAAAPSVAIPADETIAVTVAMDGRRRTFSMSDAGATVLEAAEQAGLDLPFSCRAGVCSTCRARVTRGAVTMKENYVLEAWELEAGYVLCCQSSPAAAELEIDFDER